MVEYSGIATSSALDVNAGASGTGTNLNSGTTTTTNASDLLVGASYIGGVFVPPALATPSAWSRLQIATWWKIRR